MGDHNPLVDLVGKTEIIRSDNQIALILRVNVLHNDPH